MMKDSKVALKKLDEEKDDYRAEGEKKKLRVMMMMMTTMTKQMRVVIVSISINIMDGKARETREKIITTV